MSGDVTLQALKRQTYLPGRASGAQGTVIAGQDYTNVLFTGGNISNVNIDNAIITNSSVTATGITLTPVNSPAYARGKLVYDADNESLTFFNNDSNVSLQIGQEDWIRVYNNTGSTVPNGTPVYLSGTSGGLPMIALAKADAGATVICVGLTTEAILNNSIGYVTALGVVHGLNTAAFTAGTSVYVSATTAGALTNTAPTAPNFRFRVGIVVVSDATVGAIHVTPSTGTLGTGAANQILGVNAAGTGQEYKTFSVGTAGADFGIANAAGTVTFNLPDAGSGVRGVVNTGTQTFTGAKTFSTAIAAASGGTGQSSYVIGDLLYASATNALSRLADVAVGSYLRSGGVGAAPLWSTATLPNSATTGDIMYASGANTYANLADAATGNVLLSGGVGAIPAYGKVGLTTHVTGTLPVANGGTGTTTSTGSGSVALGTSPTLTTPDIVGTATNNNANAGSVGEYVSSTVLVGSQVALTNNTAANVTSISLTAGDWDVEGVVVMNPNAATTSSFQLAYTSSTSATPPTLPNNGGATQLTITFATGGVQAHAVPRQRFSLSATTTVYLQAFATFATNTMGAYGHINARRVR